MHRGHLPQTLRYPARRPPPLPHGLAHLPFPCTVEHDFPPVGARSPPVMLIKSTAAAVSIGGSPALTLFVSGSRAPRIRASPLCSSGSTQCSAVACRERRAFATVHHDDAGDLASETPQHRPSHHHHHHSAHADVHAWPKSAHPTPYEILGMRKDAPYTKKHFYRLVKLYHPDTHPGGHISSALCLERYRLVVAANNLLSDPAKRQLYDTYGLGWVGGHPRARDPQFRHASRSWREQPGTAANNATWEDWEEWHYQRDGRTRQEPIYMPNWVFASLVVLMCAIGAWAQKTRADTLGAEYMDWLNGRHEAIGADMRRNSAALAGHTKDERIESFVRDRENVAYPFMASRYEGPYHQTHIPYSNEE